MPPTVDITGQRFGRLVVTSREGTNADKRATWNCVCDCGNKTVSHGKNLRSGTTKSCGCLKSEKSSQRLSNPSFAANRLKGQVKHGHKKRGQASKAYKIWLGMKARCERPKNKDYPRYGGRGIAICSRWASSFQDFLADMGPPPSDMHTIDRLDSEKGYELANCRWATIQEQGSENRRGLSPITINGKEYPSISAACRALGIGDTTAHYRISSGMSLDDVFAPTRRKSRRPRESYLPKGHPDRHE